MSPVEQRRPGSSGGPGGAPWADPDLFYVSDLADVLSLCEGRLVPVWRGRSRANKRR